MIEDPTLVAQLWYREPSIDTWEAVLFGLRGLVDERGWSRELGTITLGGSPRRQAAELAALARTPGATFGLMFAGDLMVGGGFDLEHPHVARNQDVIMSAPSSSLTMSEFEDLVLRWAAATGAAQGMTAVGFQNDMYGYLGSTLTRIRPLRSAIFDEVVACSPGENCYAGPALARRLGWSGPGLAHYGGRPRSEDVEEVLAAHRAENLDALQPYWLDPTWPPKPT